MRNLVDPADDPAVDDGQRRGRILWALASCMAEKGYQATTISDIARVARVSKTVVYTHFRDKEECLLELYSRANDNVLATGPTGAERRPRGRAAVAGPAARRDRRLPRDARRRARRSPGRPWSRSRPPAAPRSRCAGR